MKRRILAALILVLITTTLFGASGDIVVYRTKTGTKYHVDGCRSLSKSKIPITLEKAVNSGLTPCGICYPPTLDNTVSSLYKVIGLSSYKDADITKMLEAKVTKTVDGDTVKVLIANPPTGLDENETIRLLGVDTPETVHPFKPVERYGKEASDYTKQITGQTVYLAFDWDMRDGYDRLLAYIYLQSGDCLNASIIKDGYGFAYITYPFQFMDEFKSLETTAKENKIGLWY